MVNATSRNGLNYPETMATEQSAASCSQERRGRSDFEKDFNCFPRQKPGYKYIPRRSK
jgi:hypothetical protein